jgi:iron complex transport system ATP-binding protein
MGRTPYRSRFAPPSAADRTAVEDAIERTRIGHLADRPIDEVSGGERQRVVLARAIAQDTPVTLLDEPTASLDVNHGIETLELVSDLVGNGRTAVAAIHDLDLAARYCDALVLLADGSVLETGSPEDVLTADRLERAFDATATVSPDPVTGTPSVTTLPADPHVDAVPDRVHVVGTGTAAAGVLARLDAADVTVSVGPVSNGDALAESARTLSVDRVAVEPFAPVTRSTLDELDRRIDDADATVLVDLEIGAGNQLVLESLADADALVVVETRPFEDRNFADDGARDRYDRLRERAASADPASVLDAVCAVADDPVRSSTVTDANADDD